MNAHVSEIVIHVCIPHIFLEQHSVPSIAMGQDLGKHRLAGTQPPPQLYHLCYPPSIASSPVIPGHLVGIAVDWILQLLGPQCQGLTSVLHSLPLPCIRKQHDLTY